MRRGEIWWVSFAGSLGGEVRKTRPAIIVSNDLANLHANRVQVVPLSTNTVKIFPCEAKVLILGQESKAMADQLTTVTKEKCTGRIGVISDSEMRAVEIAMRIQLGLAA